MTLYIYIYFELLDFYYLRVISSWQNSQMSLYGCDIVCNPIVLVALLSSVSWIPCCVACLIGRVWYRMQLFLSVSCQISSFLSVSYPLIYMHQLRVCYHVSYVCEFYFPIFCDIAILCFFPSMHSSWIIASFSHHVLSAIARYTAKFFVFQVLMPNSMQYPYIFNFFTLTDSLLLYFARFRYIIVNIHLNVSRIIIFFRQQAWLFEI